MSWHHFTVSAALVASVFVLSSFARGGDDVGAQQLPAAGAEDTWRTVLPYRDVQGVLGKEVRGPAGEDMGRIIDVLVDQTAHVRAAVIDFGGFLGVGSRKVVVDWSALHFDPSEDRQQVTVDLSRNQIKEAPEYKSGKPVVVLGALVPSSGPDM